MYNCPSYTEEKSEAWRNDLSKPHKQLRARARPLSTASAVFSLPSTPSPRPGPSPREGVNEASTGRGWGKELCPQVPAGLPVVARPGPGATLPCLSALPHEGWWLISLWGGVGAPSHAGPCRDPALETQSLSPKHHSHSHSEPGQGRWGLGSPGLARRPGKPRALVGGREV